MCIRDRSGTGTLTLASTGTLQVGGANNFPSGFTTNTLNSGSTVEYNGSVAQTVATQSYSNLKINNASGASLAAATTATGLLTMSNGTPVSYTHLRAHETPEHLV